MQGNFESNYLMSGIFDPSFEKWSGLPSPVAADVTSFTGEISLPSVVDLDIPASDMPTDVER